MSRFMTRSYPATFKIRKRTNQTKMCFPSISTFQQLMQSWSKPNNLLVFARWVAALHLLTNSTDVVSSLASFSYLACLIASRDSQVRGSGASSHLQQSPVLSSASCHRAQRLVRRSHSGPGWLLRTSRARLRNPVPTETGTFFFFIRRPSSGRPLNKKWASEIPAGSTETLSSGLFS